VTSTPAYGFRISKGAGGGPMQAAMQAGDVGSIKDLLTKRYPGLQFESLSEGMEEVEKPEDTTTPAITSAVGEAAEEVTEEETTNSLFEDYMANLPAVTRPLVTTDYKGVRGGRLGAGNYTTASLIPGAQVATPAAPAAAAPAAAVAPSYTTYNYYNFPQEMQQELPQEIPEETTATDQAAAVARGMTPAWAKTSAQQGTTTKQASAGLVPSTTQRGTYVAPSSPEASRAAAGAAQRIETRQEATGNIGARAAAGSDGRMGSQAAAALIAAPGSDRKAAQAALNQASKGNISLTNNARKALQQAASGKKKK